MKNVSVQIKIFIVTCVVAVTVMCVSVAFVYRRAAKIIETNAGKYIYENISYADRITNYYIEDAKNIVLMAAVNETVITSCLSTLKEGSYDWFLRKKETDSMLKNLSINKEFINMVAVIRLDGDSFQSGGTVLLKRITLTDWFKKTLSLHSVQLWYNVPESRQILVCRPVVYGGKPVGVVVVELNYDLVYRMYTSGPLHGYNIVSFNKDGNVIFTSTHDNMEQKKLSAELTELAELLANNNNSGTRLVSIGGQKKLLVHIFSPQNSLTTAGLVSYNTLIVDSLTIRRSVALIVSFSFFFAFLSSWLLSQFISKNLKKLRDTMNKVGEGSLHVRAQVHGSDETAQIASVFNDMMNQIESLMQHIRENEKDKREAEQAVLLSQIQPHFVYNTLNSLKYVAHMKNDHEIETVATAIVELIRAVIGNSDEFIPLGQERIYIEQFLVIQRFKYQQDFDVHWTIEDGLETHNIPKLLLQPIVENALIHGVSQVKNGKIFVSVHRQEKNICFTIIDNGTGMDVMQLETLLKGVQRKKDTFSRIGIKNVFDRIRLIYGEDYGGKITSGKEGTCVTLTLPL